MKLSHKFTHFYVQFSQKVAEEHKDHWNALKRKQVRVNSAKPLVSQDSRAATRGQ